MKQHENKYVAVVERYMLDGPNTITLMKHKRRYVKLLKVTLTNDANMVARMFSTVA